jgi:signal peptidase II
MARAPAPPPRAQVAAMAWTALAVFALDQATKLLVVHALDLKNRMEIDLWPGVAAFRMAWNQGVNFGLFASFDMRWVLIALAVVISGFVAFWVARERRGRWVQVSAGLLIGGALGNVVDRLAYGAVADFLNVSCCGIDNPYAFNVADISIFLGAAGLVILSGEDRPAPKPSPKPRRTGARKG